MAENLPKPPPKRPKAGGVIRELPASGSMGIKERVRVASAAAAAAASASADRGDDKLGGEISVKKESLLKKLYQKVAQIPVQKASEFAVKELRIICMKKYNEEDPAFANINNHIFLAVPTSSTIADLKFRLHGSSGIPVKRMRLFFTGRVLNDSEAVPTTAFGMNARSPTEDEDIFRPSILLSLKRSDEEVSDDESVSSASTDPEIRAKRAAEEALREAELQAERELRAARDARARELEAIELAKYNVKSIAFNLKDDLEKINCSYYYDTLYKAGFHDEGAFAFLDDDVMQKEDIWVPKSARKRIVALANNIKQRLGLAGRPDENKLGEVSKDLLKKGVIHKRQIDGLDVDGTTKKDVQRAWEKKVREERQIKKEAEDEKNKVVPEIPPPKVHPRAVQEKIDYIRQRLAVDKEGNPLSWNITRFTEYKPCCEKHKLEIQALKSGYIAHRKRQHVDDIKSLQVRFDSQQTGFLSREMLQTIAMMVLEKDDYKVVYHNNTNDIYFHRSDNKIVYFAAIFDILEKSLMTFEKQRELSEFFPHNERVQRLSNMPTIRYDNDIFCLLLANLIEQLDQRRFVKIYQNE